MMDSNKHYQRFGDLIRSFLYSLIVLMSISILFIPTASWSQTYPTVSIQGSVIDVTTGKPLRFANVFLNNTTLGCATDEFGHFVIERVPFGMYDLVVSMMGYELESLKIHCTESETQTFKFKLKPKVLKGRTVKITAKHPRDWKKNLKKFKKLFLGTSKNAVKCRIMNPEVLSFNNEPLVFTAVAEQPIRIENRALGYHLEYHLIDFSFRENKYRRFSGVSKYSALKPNSNREQKRWVRNRIKTYMGSSRHFFIALASDSLEEAGFSVSDVLYRNPMETERYPILGKKYSPVVRFLIHEIRSPNKKEIARKILEIQNLDTTGYHIIEGKLPFERKLIFNNYLRVEYEHQVSWLEILQDTIHFNINGLIYDPYSIRYSGYWTQEGMADHLPYDYFPDEENSRNEWIKMQI